MQNQYALYVLYLSVVHWSMVHIFDFYYGQHVSECAELQATPKNSLYPETGGGGAYGKGTMDHLPNLPGYGGEY